LNIFVRRNKFTRKERNDLGGEYSTAIIDIYVDESLSLEEQKRRVIHSVIENFCRPWEHERVIELENYLMDALEQLEE
jgi:hypothetical protein